MKDNAKLTVHEKLLLAAQKLEKEKKNPFSAEDLVVSAWRDFPDTFGLAGYHNKDGTLSYPDSNRVFAEIMGSKPIRKKGFLKKIGTKMYQLTEAGREQAYILLKDSGDFSIEKTGLARQTKLELKRLFSSKAVEKVRNQRIEDLSFHDACGFWGISPRSSAIALEGRLANFIRIIEAAQRSTQGGKATFNHGGPVFGKDDLDILLRVHNELSGKFKIEIDFIKKRTDERV